MRVLLVNPASMSTFGALGILFPPLGILYVAAAARDRGYEIKVVDRLVDRRTIDFSHFDVVGIHSDTTRFNSALNLAREAKAAGAKVVMGGPHPCFEAKGILETGFVDAVVKGEGEESFPDLLDAWKSGEDLSVIPGLVVMTHQGVRDTGASRRIQDVDSLPFPARDLVDLSKYARAHLGYRSLTPVHTSRGCPYGCRFCSSTRFDGSEWRARSAESTLDELEYLVRKLGFGAVAFLDDNFTGSPARIHEICDGILKKDLDVHWWCLSRVDTIVKHPKMVKHMAEAGAFSIFTGIETPSSDLLDHFRKRINPDQAWEAINILKEHGIETWGAYILGSPEEGRADIRSTIRFARKMDTNIAQFTLLTPYPGTALYDELKDRIVVKDWSKYDGNHAVFKHPTIPRIELQLWSIWAYIAFYFRHRRSIAGFCRFLVNRMNMRDR